MITAGDVSVRTLVSIAISAVPYRKVLIIKLCFHQILTFTNTSSLSFIDLISTVATYFSLNTGSAEREAETTVAIIRSHFFLISDIQGVELTDASRKSIAILDLDKRPEDLAYLIFAP